jgi:hypothetical protein
MAVFGLVMALAGVSHALKGIDFAGPMKISQAQCLIKAGYGDFAIVRAWHSYGAFDTDAAGAIANLRQGGYKNIDVYMFPCPTKNVVSQVKDMVANLSAHGVRYGRVWLDIEEDPSTNCGWYADKTRNCQIMSDLAKAINDTGLSWGTYCSNYEWSTLFGPACTVPLAARRPLWYAHYEKPPNPSFSDFKPFGGWSTPYSKQYDDTDGGVCVGGLVDVSWLP